MRGRPFNKRLTLTTSTKIEDSAGGFVKQWEEQGALWAHVKMRSGELKHTEFGRTPRLSVRISTHFIPEGHRMRPTAGDRLIEGRRTFEVQAVHDDDDRLLSILASEIPSGEGK